MTPYFRYPQGVPIEGAGEVTHEQMIGGAPPANEIAPINWWRTVRWDSLPLSIGGYEDTGSLPYNGANFNVLFRFANAADLGNAVAAAYVEGATQISLVPSFSYKRGNNQHGYTGYSTSNRAKVSEFYWAAKGVSTGRVSSDLATYHTEGLVGGGEEGKPYSFCVPAMLFEYPPDNLLPGAVLGVGDNLVIPVGPIGADPMPGVEVTLTELGAAYVRFNVFWQHEPLLDPAPPWAYAGPGDGITIHSLGVTYSKDGVQSYALPVPPDEAVFLYAWRNVQFG